MTSLLSLDQASAQIPRTPSATPPTPTAAPAPSDSRISRARSRSSPSGLVQPSIATICRPLTAATLRTAEAREQRLERSESVLGIFRLTDDRREGSRRVEPERLEPRRRGRKLRIPRGNEVDQLSGEAALALAHGEVALQLDREERHGLLDRRARGRRRPSSSPSSTSHASMSVGTIGTTVHPGNGARPEAATAATSSAVRLVPGRGEQPAPTLDDPGRAAAVAGEHAQHATDPLPLLRRADELLIAILSVEQFPLSVLHVVLDERLDHGDERHMVRDCEQREAMLRTRLDERGRHGGDEWAGPEPDGRRTGSGKAGGEDLGR